MRSDNWFSTHIDRPSTYKGIVAESMANSVGFGTPSMSKGLAQPGFAGMSFMGGAPSEFMQAGRFAKAGKSAMAMGAAGRGLAGAFAPALSLGFIANGAVSGFQTGGMVGAAKGAASEALFSIGGAIAFRGLASPPGLIGAAVLATGAAAGYGGYKAMEASWQYHLKSLPLETAGSMDAFTTGNAATMRQRSMQSIGKSHLNARASFSNEAQWMHIARYRGIGRRGTM